MKTGRATYRRFFTLLFCLLFPAALSAPAQVKSLALIPADKHPVTQAMTEMLASSLEGTFRLADPELVETVAGNSAGKNLFNLSADEAKNIGTGIGCDYYLVLRSENYRRSSSKKNVYYEAYFVTFLINARSGELMAWKHLGAEADEPGPADKALLALFEAYVRELPVTLRKAAAAEPPVFDPSIYQINESSESNEQALRTPLPFRRFSPASTSLAQYLRIEAVVDIEVAIDEKGYITQTKIMRWGGFGLDETVTETVRKMNFRPAILAGKAIPVRFLLRYNFRLPVANKETN
jgi:hypothetical protein